MTDHMIDHLAEVEALLGGAETIPDAWHGRSLTLDSDWSRFSEADLDEARSRLARLGHLYELRYAAAGPDEWDRPRGSHRTLRAIAAHVAEIGWYADQIGLLRSHLAQPSTPVPSAVARPAAAFAPRAGQRAGV